MSFRRFWVLDYTRLTLKPIAKKGWLDALAEGSHFMCF